MEKKKKCPSCFGSGVANGQPCYDCRGTGVHPGRQVVFGDRDGIWTSEKREADLADFGEILLDLSAQIEEEAIEADEGLAKILGWVHSGRPYILKGDHADPYCFKGIVRNEGKIVAVFSFIVNTGVGHDYTEMAGRELTAEQEVAVRQWAEARLAPAKGAEKPKPMARDEAVSVGTMNCLVSKVCSAFESSAVGSRVIDPKKFFAALGRAVEAHDPSTDRVPGQHGNIVLPVEVYATLSAGVGKRTAHPADFVLAEHRGEVDIYLRRGLAVPVSAVAVSVYTVAAYLADPEVSADKVECDRVTASGATHVLVSVRASAGPRSPLTPKRFVDNLAGGNKEAREWSGNEIRAKATEISRYYSEWAVVADEAPRTKVYIVEADYAPQYKPEWGIKEQHPTRAEAEASLREIEKMGDYSDARISEEWK